MSTLESVTESNFESDVLQSSNPVIVDFWAEWCGPCKMIAPILEEAASEYGDKVKFVKLNVDSSSSLAAKYGVRGIPTLILFKEGKVAGTKSGYMSKSQLTDFINSLL